MKKFLVILMFLLNILGFSALKNGIYSVEKNMMEIGNHL